MEEFRKTMPKSEAEDLCSNKTPSYRPEFHKTIEYCVSYWKWRGLECRPLPISSPVTHQWHDFGWKLTFSLILFPYF